jgi:hypothetical protein
MSTTNRSRRALLRSAAAGVAAAAGAALIKPAGALAGTGDPMLIDYENYGSGETQFVTTGEWAFTANSHHDTGVGVAGVGAVTETSSSWGLFGDGDVGVLALGYFIGASGTGFVGVYGSGAVDGVGVVGFTGDALLGPEPPAGVGVLAQAETTNLTALYVAGKAHFTRSGVATVKSGKASVVVSLPGVVAGSMILAVIRQNKASRWVRAAVAASGSFTIYLNSSVTTATAVNWFVLD